MPRSHASCIKDVVVMSEHEPTGAVPGQAGKVLTRSLTLSGSFSDPERAPLITKIKYSAEQERLSLSKQQASVRVENAGCTGRYNWKNIAVFMCLWGANLLSNVAYSMINPFFPELAESKGVSPFVSGLIIGSAPFCVVVLSPICGYVLPYFGVWCQVFFGLVLIGSSYVALGFMDLITAEWTFIVACVLLRSLEGVGTAMLTTAIFSTFPQLFPNAVGTLVGLFELGGGVGYSMGPSLGAVVYKYGGYKVPFLSVGGAILVFAIPCALLVRKMNVVQEKKSLPFRVICKISTDLPFILLVLVVVLAYTPSSVVVPSFPIFIDQYFPKQDTIISGLLFFTVSGCYFLSTLVIGPITDKVGCRRFIIICGMFLVSCGFFLIGIPFYMGYMSLWLLYVSFALIGTGDGSSVVPIYPELLKIAEGYLEPGDSKEGLVSFISGVITASLHMSVLQWLITGGILGTFLPIPVIATIVGLVMLSQAILVMGVSVIARCTSS